jgi:hypothetical protein
MRETLVPEKQVDFIAEVDRLPHETTMTGHQRPSA